MRHGQLYRRTGERADMTAKGYSSTTADHVLSSGLSRSERPDTFGLHQTGADRTPRDGYAWRLEEHDPGCDHSPRQRFGP